MTSQEIRKAFLKFFEKNEHTVVPSDSLIPSSDPTLLFTSAGMVQFKTDFLGAGKKRYRRAASCQKCLRTSDIDRVGTTARHLTFFEMLGNFSFGDYFKEDAIAWGWEFLTKTVKLPKDRLTATVFREDDEAMSFWKRFLPESRIVRLGEDSNFWNMGPTGPCGPCSEIIFDRGESHSHAPGGACDLRHCPPECDRWLEIWNLVFTQFDRQEDGSLKALPQKNIDTGMGLERLACVLQGKESNFETDILGKLIDRCQHIFESEKDYKLQAGTHQKAFRIIADHARAVTMMISDGILPSNEGRGYVLRRLLRRAIRQGTFLGKKEPFLSNFAGDVARSYKSVYPEIDERLIEIKMTIDQEEKRFLSTLAEGSARLDGFMITAKQKNERMIPAAEVFKLYDTYGFPEELTEEILGEQNLSYDTSQFIKLREESKKLSKETWQGSGARDINTYVILHKEIGDTVFRGYETLALKSRVKAILKDTFRSNELRAGEAGEVILQETPFYAESGGQVGDTGTLEGSEVVVEVLDTQRPSEGLIVHKVRIVKGVLKESQLLEARVDPERRAAIRRHHTATHLLHAVLRRDLGSHVIQFGSLVAPDRLRFDYAHTGAPSAEELEKIERDVNRVILKNLPVQVKVSPIEEARKMGAMALFGEKYGKEVRCILVSDEDFEHPERAESLELCGGTHCRSTGEIGAFKITAESSVGSGLRRIEAVAGEAALQFFKQTDETIHALSEKLRATPQELLSKVEKLVNTQKDLERQLKEARLQLAEGGKRGRIDAAPQDVDGIPVMIKIIPGLDESSLRSLADRLKESLPAALILVASLKEEDKISFVIRIPPDLIKQGFNGSVIAKNLASKISGSAGGRPDFAQGGGKGHSQLESILKNLSVILSGGVQRAEGERG
jgi:alanyl-tRNA synthetase